jgi:hypothetical protein
MSKSNDTGIRFPDVEVQLTGEDGNAFGILGRISRELRRSGATADEVSEFTTEATSGDYDHLLRTAMRWVRVA